MWSVLVFAVVLVASGSGIPIGIGGSIGIGIGSPIGISSPISTAGRPLVSVLSVPEARAHLVGEIEGLMDELDLPCKDSVRTTLFVALMHFEGSRVAMETARFKELEVMPLMAKLDMRTKERVTAAIHRFYREVLEEPVIAEHEWAIDSGKNTIVKTFIRTFLHLERTLREGPELLTVGEVKRSLMTVLSELKDVRDCSALISRREAEMFCERIMTRFITPIHMEKSLYTLETELHTIIHDPIMRKYIRDVLETMATKSISFMAYMLTSLNTLIHSGTRPTEILVNWLYTIATMTTHTGIYANMDVTSSIYKIKDALEPFGKPDSLKYPFARYPSYANIPYARYPSHYANIPSPFRIPLSYSSSYKFPSSYPSRYPGSFPSSYPSIKYPMSSSAYPYHMPISALPYPSPFPMSNPFLSSGPIPSDMSHLANKLYSTPYLFALGSGHHLKVKEGLESVISTIDMARSINLPSPADPCFSQKITAFNAVLVTVLNGLDYTIIKSTLALLLKEVALSSPSGYPMHELLRSPEKEIIHRILGMELLKPEMVSIERLYNIPELRPILSHHYALLSSVISGQGHISPKMIAAALQEVAEVIRNDEALCRIDVRRVVPHIEEVLAHISSSLSWESIEPRLISGWKQCLAVRGIEGIPETEIIEIISKVKPVFMFHLRHHGKILSSLIANLREGRAHPDVIADMLVALEETNMAAETMNMSPYESMWGERSWSEGSWQKMPWSEMPMKMWRRAFKMF